MNKMMISYYELLGMIKEGKQPKKVKYDDGIFEWDDYDYISSANYLSNYLNERRMFDKNIEIIEEDKDIEELNYEEHIGVDLVETIYDKINELIREVNKLRKEDK